MSGAITHQATADVTPIKPPKKPHFDTLQVHAGYQPEMQHGSRQVPIYNSTSFVFDNAEDGRARFAGEKKAMIYSRVTNPTLAAFEGRIAALEGGLSAVSFATGEAAIANTFLTLVSGPGQNFVSASALFGGTIAQFRVMLSRMGIEMRFADILNLQEIESLIDENTRGIFCESISNPTQMVADLPALAEIARRHGIPLIVDNTAGMGGWCLRPFDHGAHIVVESATKWLSGHGTVMGGVVIDGDSFDWRSSKFPDFTREMEGLAFGRFIDRAPHGTFAVKCRSETLRDLGATMSPFNAQQIVIGLETLSLRAERHIKNAVALAEWLDRHPKVSKVYHPCLPHHPSHEVAKKICPRGAGSVLAFAPKGGRAEAFKVLDGLKLVSILVNIGDAKTVATHVGTTTHSLLLPDMKRDTGITDDLIRVSVGIEWYEDIIDDFEQSLAVL